MKLSCDIDNKVRGTELLVYNKTVKKLLKSNDLYS